MEGILLFGCELVEGNPEVGAVVCLVELVFVADGPVVEVSYDKDVFRCFGLACGVGAERNFCVVSRVVVDTVEYACGSVGAFRRSGCF